MRPPVWKACPFPGIAQQSLPLHTWWTSGDHGPSHPGEEAIMLGRERRLQAYSFRLVEKVCGEPHHDCSIPLPDSLAMGMQHAWDGCWGKM